MRSRFSDRIGATSPPTTLQLQEMSQSLRNRLWNCLLLTIFAGDNKYHKLATKLICARFFILPLDDLEHVRDWEHKDWLKKFFFDKDFEWHQVYNLIEFIADNWQRMPLARSIPNEEFKRYINLELEREMSGYRFISDSLAPIASAAEAESIRLAEQSELFGTKHHIKSAVALLSIKPDPDYLNSIKESISAIESLVKQITEEEGGGLGKALAKLDAEVKFHGAFKSGLLSLYGYTCGEKGIRHPIIIDGSRAGLDEAKFMLVACSALVNFIIAKATQCGLLIQKPQEKEI